MELSEAACLGLLITEAGGHIEDLEGQCIVEQTMLDQSADSACGTLGLEGDGAVAFILEGIHFLLDDVGSIADSAVKEFGMLKGRRTDLLITEVCCFLGSDGLDILPFIAVCRQDVLRTAGSAGKKCHNKHPFKWYIYSKEIAYCFLIILFLLHEIKSFAGFAPFRPHKMSPPPSKRFGVQEPNLSGFAKQNCANAARKGKFAT